MKKSFGLCFLVCLYFSTAAYAADWSGSGVVMVTKNLNNKVNVTMRILNSFKNDMQDHYLGYVQVIPYYKLTKWFEYGLGFRGYWLKKSDGWTYENRPVLDLKFKTKWEGFRLSNRSRFEYREYNYNKRDNFRYRNQTIVVSPWKLTSLELIPSLAEEVFYNINSREIEMNWLIPGIMYKINDNSQVQLSYRWQQQKIAGKWEGLNVLSVTFHYSF